MEDTNEPEWPIKGNECVRASGKDGPQIVETHGGSWNVEAEATSSTIWLAVATSPHRPKKRDFRGWPSIIANGTIAALPNAGKRPWRRAILGSKRYLSGVLRIR